MLLEITGPAGSYREECLGFKPLFSPKNAPAHLGRPREGLPPHGMLFLLGALDPRQIGAYTRLDAAFANPSLEDDARGAVSRVIP